MKQQEMWIIELPLFVLSGAICLHVARPFLFFVFHSFRCDFSLACSALLSSSSSPLSISLCLRLSLLLYLKYIKPQFSPRLSPSLLVPTAFHLLHPLQISALFLSSILPLFNSSFSASPPMIPCSHFALSASLSSSVLS